ncbi:Phosphopantothenoylcysteine decarboxylase [Roseimaritima multifibrata]|uniref:Phosphopantothenoylcysteine decarboxylase n=1 Tax=Roseimaritima multifibrata TaxID=1930274 RepID=A0A517MK74_9BACT|nr:flavoprotein [Roseimaritima multifibrata]QDS95187.1 Phosphopantothenoylcysteine decarboxylase [Roseimaritima multifibrata]
MPPRHVVVAIGAGIAAYKSATLVSRLVQQDFAVRVVMTSGAQEFIGQATLAALSGHPVASDRFDPAHHPLGTHIEWTKDADLLIVAPATADLLGKFANGIADTLLTTMWLQAECPLLLAPAMSNVMWEKPSVQRNVAQLREDGIQMIGPDHGWLSCRRKGPGRMAEPEAILEAAKKLL